MHAKIIIRRIKDAEQQRHDAATALVNNKQSKNLKHHFRPWEYFLEEAKAFRQTHGHCVISQKLNAKPELARWAKRQRFQYKQYMRYIKGICSLTKGQRQRRQQQQRSCSMTPERIAALNEIGFCWDAHEQVWEERFNDLREFYTLYGHFNVPTGPHRNDPLATWVRQQRYEYRLWKQGKTHSITVARVAKLTAIGFPWEAKYFHNKKKTLTM